VGGDVSAGYASLALDPEKPGPGWPFLLADLGTNGEFLLALSPREGLAASVALGPALEGIGLSCGTEARPGAVTGFSLSARGLRPVFFREDFASPAVGITGTGYLSLLHVLLRAGALAEDGRFTFSRSPVLRKMGIEFCSGSRADAPAPPEREGAALLLGGNLFLSAGDVEEILKVRAAFALALEKLLAAGGLAGRDVALLCLAGALGEHVGGEDLVTLGFVPRGLPVRAVGNAALAGAALLALKPGKGAALARLCRKARQIFLARDASFHREYLERIGFGNSDFAASGGAFR
jgi:uncharacterized 2Fe-2S/4Fe-4S cluster protein (DUF4445 family)